MKKTVHASRLTQEWVNPDIETASWWTTEPRTLTQEDVRKEMEKLYRKCCDGAWEPRDPFVIVDEDT